MPSAKVLEQKQAIVAELTERLKNSVTGVLVNYKGINVADDTALRKELREAGVQYSVVKNTLLSRACEEAELTGLQTTLAGTTALATSDEDYAAAARILANYAKKSKTFEIKGGYLDGEVVDLATIESLSKLPTREVLLANVLGAFQAPIASFARAIQAIVDEGGVEECLAKKAPAEDAAPAEADASDAPAEEATEAPAEAEAPAAE
ncbi:50S ribosomal protein L10 [Ruminococcus sp. M6(2020)]|uniref:Large ribosomal subunit protein uL10 n=1 Tax=Ruminococcus difficilis TaxID=2763069 RepID=A0A934TYC1_9FIRM|nr:50S ribosomal protein L10 [Ruminococcus difficilis]MBK6087431.1 50S ribosomal protein L10 [Ruminococcus difficilis]